MGFFIKDEDYKTIICLDEAALNVTDKKYRDKPVIIVRSSYEHQQGDSLTSRSSHRPGIKLKRGKEYGDLGLEIYTTDEHGNVGACLAKDSGGYKNKIDKVIATRFIKKYHAEIDRIYNAKPGTQEYNDAINDLVSKNDGKYLMKVKNDE